MSIRDEIIGTPRLQDLRLWDIRWSYKARSYGQNKNYTIAANTLEDALAGFQEWVDSLEDKEKELAEGIQLWSIVHKGQVNLIRTD